MIPNAALTFLCRSQFFPFLYDIPSQLYPDTASSVRDPVVRRLD